MTIWSQHDIDERGRNATVELEPGDLLTPLARDRAAELGITIRYRSTMEPYEAQLAPQDSRAPSGGLYRRGLPLDTSSRLSRVGRLQRVGIVGVGHVGATAALMLASANLADEVLLVDVVPGRAAGIALDVSHVAGISGFTSQVSSVDSVEQLKDADVVVVTAGRPRQPGMSRADLLKENAAILEPVANSLGQIAPSTVLIVVTNPLDEMTELAYRASRLPASSVLGMAGVLDAARFRAAAAKAAGSPVSEVDALALGSHGDEMVIPAGCVHLRGRPLDGVVGSDTFVRLVDETRAAGAEIVRLLGSGSAYFAPAASIHQILVAIADDSRMLVGACARATGQYGIDGVYLGLPVRIGRRGIDEIVELDLLPSEVQELRRAADAIRQRCGGLTAAPRA